MATVIMSNPSPADPQVQAYVNQGATLRNNQLIWPDGHPNDTAGGGTAVPMWNLGGNGGYNPQQPASGAGGNLDLYNTDYIIAQQQMSLEYELQNLNREHDERMRNIDQGFQSKMAAEDRRLQDDLLNKQINNSQYMQQRDLAQREAEFARSIAFDQERFRHQKKIDEAQVKLGEAAEARMERQLRAELSANPTDWVAYEEYMRQVQDPSYLARAESMGTGAGAEGALVGQSGQPYPESPAAAGDDRIRGLANSITGGGNLEYNPNLSGTGYAGANIPSPNQFSREHLMSLSDTEMKMLTGLLQAGIDIGGGQRVAVNPADFFQQAENSFIPTLAEAGPSTQYGF